MIGTPWFIWISPSRKAVLCLSACPRTHFTRRELASMAQQCRDGTSENESNSPPCHLIAKRRCFRISKRVDTKFRFGIVNSDMADFRICDCGSGRPSQWEYDAQNIPLCRVCSACKTEKLKKYRPEILSGYDQNDVNENIEPEPDSLGSEKEWFFHHD